MRNEAQLTPDAMRILMAALHAEQTRLNLIRQRQEAQRDFAIRRGVAGLGDDSIGVPHPRQLCGTIGYHLLSPGDTLVHYFPDLSAADINHKARRSETYRAHRRQTAKLARHLARRTAHS